MKVVYGAGSHIGAGLQLSRFLLNTSEEIKIAAHIANSEELLRIDWNLDALISNTDNFFTVLDDISDWKPDLVISDFEPVTAKIAGEIGCPLWLCSPIHLLNGVDWPYGFLKNKRNLQKIKILLNALPPADKTFIYSPFGDIIGRPLLKNNYEWVRPYFKKISNEITFCNGETSYIADCFYSEKKIGISPNISDPESIINTLICEYYNLALDIGKSSSNSILVKRREDMIQNWAQAKNYLSYNNISYLHEHLTVE